MLDEKVHGPEKMVVVDLAPVNAGAIHPFHLVQEAELRLLLNNKHGKTKQV